MYVYVKDYIKMDNKRVFTIQINGITESVSAVESLNKQLNELEQRIKDLDKSTVSVGTSGGGVTSRGGGSKSSSLSEEEKLARQIAQIDEKRAAYSKELYQNYLAAKDVLKETVNDQKQLAAAERLQADSYSNTMAGLKEKLADLKSVHFTTDMSSDEFLKQTQEINAVNQKLKELEQEYGVYSRNVGNYANGVAEGLQKLKINIGDTTKEFDNAKQALKELKKERDTLSVKKDMGLISEEEAKRLEDLIPVVAELQSSIQDAGKPMDNLLDAMQSFVSLGQVTNGFSAFFGIDDSEIQRSIQKLVALQNALQGLQTIQKQLQSNEGIGKIFKGSDKAIDSFISKIRGAKEGMDGLATGSKSAGTGVKFLTSAIKILSKIGIVALFTAAAWAIEKVVSAISDWVKGDADLVDSTAAINSSIKKQNEELEENLRLIKEKENTRQITSAEARIEEEKAYAKALKESRDQFLKNEQTYMDNGIVQRGKTDTYLTNAYGDKGVTSFGGFDKEIKGIDDFVERFDYLLTRVQNGQDITNSYKDTVEDAKDELVHMTKVAGGDFYNAMVKLADGTEKGTKSLVEYIRHMDELTKGRYSQAIKLGIDQGYLDGQFKLAWEKYEKLSSDVYKSPLQVQLELNAKISTTLDGLDPTRAIKRDIENWENLLKAGVDGAGNVLTFEQRANISKIIDEQKKGLDKRNSSLKSGMKKSQKTVQDAQNTLNQLELRLMNEGLNKKMRQLDEEERQTINKLKENGRKTGEEITKVQNSYAELRKREIDEYLKELEKSIQETADNIAQIKIELNIDDLEKQIESLKNEFEKLSTDAPIRNTILSKSDIKDVKSLYGVTESKMEDASLYNQLFNEAEATKKADGYYKFLLNYLAKKDKELFKELSADLIQYNTALEKATDDKEKVRQQDNIEKTFKIMSDMFEGDYAKELLVVRSYTDKIDTTLEKSFERRLKAQRVYDDTVRQNLIKNIQDQGKLNEQLINAEEKLAKQALDLRIQNLKDRRDKLQETIKNFTPKNDSEVKQLEKLKEDLGKINGQIEVQEENKELKLTAISNKYENQRKQNAINTAKEIASVQEKYFNEQITNFRDGLSKLSDLMNKSNRNSWGIINLSAISRDTEEAKKTVQKMGTEIAIERMRLEDDWRKGLITPEAKNAIVSQLNDIERTILQFFGIIKAKSEDKIGEFINSLIPYINAIGNGLSNILNALWDAEDAAYDKYIEELDKSIDAVKERYDKMDELAEEHKNNVEEIEDLIAQAQGDAREHLLERYQAEIQAQRDAIREKRKAEKEEETLEQKKEREEQKQREREHDRAVTQAIISAALATANGYATTPFLPTGLAMGTLAAALGAAQIAIIKSQKYGDGGVIEGKSHAAGGVKVLGGRAEVEGGEYITNKVTTAKNVELLEYINTKKRRVNLDDLIEFYGNPVRKNIQAVRTRFADGGELPTLSNNISIGNGLATAMQEYANRPTVVSVVDIIDKTQKVNNVKVMAGLNV